MNAGADSGGPPCLPRDVATSMTHSRAFVVLVLVLVELVISCVDALACNALDWLLLLSSVERGNVRAMGEVGDGDGDDDGDGDGDGDGMAMLPSALSRHVVTLKGRVACEVSTSEELTLAEAVLAGVFGSLTPAECAGVCSLFVCQEKK